METTLINQKQAGEKLLRVLFFTLIISVMNATVFNVVLPVIMQEFKLTSSQVSWTGTGYMIIYAIGTITYGKLADRYRLKDLLTFGLIFMALGSIVGLVATEYWLVVAGRMLQAAGGSVIPATAMIIPVRYFSPEKRGRALGTMASGLALGIAIGPIIAGFITSLLSWRFLFCLSLLALLTLPFYRKYLDDNRGEATKIDYLGGLMLAGSIALVLLAITNGGWALFGIGLILLLFFLIRIRSTAEPFIQPALFQNRHYSFGLLVTVLSTAVNVSVPFITPLMLSHINHMSPAYIGFIMFPGAITAALLGRTGGKLADKKGNSFVFCMAAALQIISLIFLSVVAGLSPIFIAFFLIFGNLGQTFITIALSNTVSRTLSRAQAGVGMGLFQMLMFISGAIFNTLEGKVLDFNPANFQLNFFLINPGGVVYSNIFAIMALVVALNTLLYYKVLGKEAVNQLMPSKRKVINVEE